MRFARCSMGLRCSEQTLSFIWHGYDAWWWVWRLEWSASRWARALPWTGQTPLLMRVAYSTARSMRWVREWGCRSWLWLTRGNVSKLKLEHMHTNAGVICDHSWSWDHARTFTNCQCRDKHPEGPIAGVHKPSRFATICTTTGNARTESRYAL